MSKEITLPENGLVRLKTVLDVLSVSRSQWYRGIQRGIFPPPVKFGDRCARWRARDIHALIDGARPSESE